MRKPRNWSAGELARMKKAVEDGIIVSELAKRFRTTHDKIIRIAKERGWQAPKSPPKVKKVPKPKAGASYALANLVQDRRKAIEAQDRKLYGNLLDDVNFLRARDFGIHVEHGQFRLGNKLVDAKAIRETAARERRLSAAREVGMH